MSPQLVDFDADGHADMIVGTFEGIAYRVPGSAEGFGEAVPVLDRDGNSIKISQVWDHGQKRWLNVGKGHCISVVAFDWEGDGDYDLLLGSKKGRLYLRRNEGKPGAPRFTTKNEPVMIGSTPLEVRGGLTAPRVVDWNRDGRLDLVCGRFDGGVSVFIDQARSGAPHFAQAATLIPPAKGHDPMNRAQKPIGEKPLRPTDWCYVDAVDYDGDGDLDLVCGGKGVWRRKARKLDAQETQRAAALKAEIAAVEKRMNKVITSAKGKAIDMKAYRAISQEKRALEKKLGELIPPVERSGRVWLYRRL